MSPDAPSRTAQTFTIGAALLWGEGVLSGAGITNAHMECLWILHSLLREELLSSNPLDLLLMREHALPASPAAAFREKIARRRRRMPLAYVLGCQNFMGLDFLVDENVLVPRPETEILAAALIERAEGAAAPRILDIGTGSGNIAVLAARSLPGAHIVALDLSAPALALAEKNAALHSVRTRIAFLESDLRSFLAKAPDPGRQFDFIVSNPPYVKSGEFPVLQPEIHYEPRLALDGGADGLEAVRVIVGRASVFLKGTGTLLLEVGYDQAGEVAALMEEEGLARIERLKDEAGIERVVIARHG